MKATTRRAGCATTPAENGTGPAPSAPPRQRMHAIVQDEYGTADALRIDEIDRPTIAPDEVLVRVQAAGLDGGTWHFMAGMPYLFRSWALACADRMQVRRLAREVLDTYPRLDVLVNNVGGFWNTRPRC